MAYRRNLHRDRSADKQAELNTALRTAIANRPGWGWARNHGGYAQYDAGTRRIAIVRGDVTTGKYDAEKIGLPFNDGIKYDVTDAREIVRIVEEFMS